MPGSLFCLFGGVEVPLSKGKSFYSWPPLSEGTGRAAPFTSHEAGVCGYIHRAINTIRVRTAIVFFEWSRLVAVALPRDETKKRETVFGNMFPGIMGSGCAPEQRTPVSFDTYLSGKYFPRGLCWPLAPLDRYHLHARSREQACSAFGAVHVCDSRDKEIP